MYINRKRAATDSPINQRGFTLLQVLIIVALISIITTFGTIGIVKARAHLRLAGSARTFAGLAEKARADSVRRHAMGASMAGLQLLSTTSYSVTMDFDRNGVIDVYDTQVFNLDSNVTFEPRFVGTSINFDWRGRSVTGQVTPVMVLSGPASGAALITISGSGDITLDSESFPDGSIPVVTLNGNPTGDIRPDPPPNPLATPTPSGSTSPTPTPTPTPTPDPNATPTPTPAPCGNNGTNCRPPSPTPTPTPTPVPTPTPAPSPTPIPAPCTLTASPTTLTIANKGTQSVVLSVANASGSTTVSVSSNTNSAHISVTLAPGQTGTVTGGSGSVTFNVVVNGINQRGVISFTASSPCSASASAYVNQ